MGKQFTIDGDEAFALASELAALHGTSLDEAVTASLRASIVRAQERRRRIAAMTEAAESFRRSLTDPPASSAHDWLYDDDTGLPT